MYVPSSFAETDHVTLLEFVEKHSFATLVSHGDAGPFASHVPLLLDRTAGSQGRLIGHMARANPQWEHAEGQRVLIIFHGPHAYVSPGWYEALNVVPTWNYVAVHVYGTLKLETDRRRLFEMLERAVEQFEVESSQAWSIKDADPAYLDKMIDAIVGFHIDVEQIEGKWKLNQNHDESRRKKVIQALLQAGGEDQRQIAALMIESLES